MKKIISAIVLIVIFISIIFAFNTSSNTVGGLLNSNEFISQYKTVDNAVLVDVRTPEEFEQGHIEGSINIDFENSNFEDEINKLDKSKNYFIYCRSGNRSSKASIIMKDNGISNIYELKGGISASPSLVQ